MSDTSDWEFRSKFLREQADYLDAKARQFEAEALRYRGLAEQADYIARNPSPLSPADRGGK